MRILQIVHYFLPKHVAGVEVYTDHLTRRLAASHDVALLYSEVEQEADNYELRRGEREGVKTYELINNHHFRNFRETYQNAIVDERISEVLDEFEPDIVHIQHLINFSLDILAELRRRGIPVVFTLHDHWLACANGGQRFNQDWGRCDVLDAGQCGRCTAHMNRIGLSAKDILRRRLVRSASPSNVLLLTDLEPTSVDTPVRDFVYRDFYPDEGEDQPTWVAHPPARIRFRVQSESAGRFVSNVSLHPSTFDQSGGAVRFSVHVDGEEASAVTLDPKQTSADRQARRIEVPLAPGELRLELRSESVPAEANEFCTCGWIAPRVVSATGRPRAVETRIGRLASKIGRVASGLSARAQARRISERWQTIRSLSSEVDLFLAPSQYLGDAMVEFGLPRERVLHSDYGFVTDEFKRRDDLPEFARRFGFVGSLVRHKGVHILLEAFSKLPEDAQLDVCGSPDYDPIYFNELLQLADHPGIRFVGGLSPDRIPGFLLSLDAQIVCSIWNENSPLTIHEAFMTGIPIVSSRMGGAVELVEQGGGLLYDPDDPQDLANQLLRLYHEPGLARSLGASAPPVKPMDFHCDELVSIYSDLIGSRSD